MQVQVQVVQVAEKRESSQAGGEALERHHIDLSLLVNYPAPSTVGSAIRLILFPLPNTIGTFCCHIAWPKHQVILVGRARLHQIDCHLACQNYPPIQFLPHQSCSDNLRSNNPSLQISRTHYLIWSAFAHTLCTI